MFHSFSRSFLLSGLLVVLVACTPQPTVLPSATPLPPSVTPVPSETPIPAPHAIDLGVLGKGSAMDMAWSPDGNSLAIASSTGVYLYETTAWQVKQTISKDELGGETVRALTFTEDGTNLILTSGYAGAFKQYDLSTGQLATWFGTASYDNNAPVFSPDGSAFAFINLVCDSTGEGANNCRTTLELHEGTTDERYATLLEYEPRQEKEVNIFTFSPDGQWLAAGCEDNLVRVWEAKEGNLVYTFAHESSVASLSFSPDSQVLASASKDATVRFWDLETGQNLHILRGFNQGIQSVAYLEEGKKLLVGLLYENMFREYAVNEVYLPLEPLGFTMEVGKPLFDEYPPINPNTTVKIRLSPDTRRMAVLLNANVQIWDLETGKFLLTIPEYNSRIYAMAFNAQGDQFAIADHNIHLWQVSPPKWLASLPVNTYEIEDIAFLSSDN